MVQVQQTQDVFHTMGILHARDDNLKFFFCKPIGLDAESLEENKTQRAMK